MRPAPVAAALLLLAACAPAGQGPRPLEAQLSDQRLRLEMSDGRVCVLPRAQAARNDAAGWGGPVAGCPGVARVEVALQRPAVLRAAVDAVFGALNFEGALMPVAEVRVLSETGRLFVFATPPEPPEVY